MSFEVIKNGSKRIVVCLILQCLFSNVLQAKDSLAFEEFYSNVGVLGLTFSDKVKRLSGQKVVVNGFMAPPLKAEADFFVLTKMPMAICPFCSSDADWPSDILVVYLKKRQTFVQYNAIIQVEGALEYGSWTDTQSGFVSLLRLRDAVFKRL
jgi:hypothetical protein